MLPADLDRRETYVVRAELALEADTDPRAPGGAVTVALCGSWDHEPPCRWPHNNDQLLEGTTARFRTVFVAPPEDANEIRARIESALRSDPRWRTRYVAPGNLNPDERALGERLRQTLEE